MTDKEKKLAYEYALGLLTEQQKDDIEMTNEFKQELLKWRKKLTFLYSQDSLNKSSSKVIWGNISKNINNNKSPWLFDFINSKIWSNTQNIHNNKSSLLLGFIHAKTLALIATAFLLVFSSLFVFKQIQNNDNIYNKIIIADAMGWKVNTDTANNNILITAIDPMQVGKNKVCVLWVRKDNNTQYIGTLPNDGTKIIAITEKISQMLNQGEIIISIESVKSPMAIPTKIEYRKYLS